MSTDPDGATAPPRIAPPSVPLDPLHAGAVEAACDLDRAYALQHKEARGYVRPALAHELCLPGGSCRIVETVRVFFVAPGSRIRVPG